MLVLSWSSLQDGVEDGVAMLVAYEAVRGVRFDYCEEHGTEALARLDFSALATATTDEHVH